MRTRADMLTHAALLASSRSPARDPVSARLKALAHRNRVLWPDAGPESASRNPSFTRLR